MWRDPSPPAASLSYTVDFKNEIKAETIACLTMHLSETEQPSCLQQQMGAGGSCAYVCSSERHIG